MKQKILVIAAHPDDETLGCGGTISKFTKENYEARVIFLSDGVGSRKNPFKPKTKDIKLRKRHALNACKLLGFKKIKFFDLPDNSLDTLPRLKITKIIEKEIATYKPDLFFTHFINDLNLDHRIVAESVTIATRLYKKKHTILNFEVLSSTNLKLGGKKNIFIPNFYVDVKSTIKNKIKAMKEYKSEIHNFPHPRSEEGLLLLSKYRGMFAGFEYAEAFYMLKKTI